METKKEKEVIAEHFRALAKKSWEKRKKDILLKGQKNEKPISRKI